MGHVHSDEVDDAERVIYMSDSCIEDKTIKMRVRTKGDKMCYVIRAVCDSWTGSMEILLVL